MVESGASRHFEPWHEEDEVVDKEKRKQEAEEMGDAMRALENRANDSKQDMDILAALEEMQSMESKHAGVSVKQVLEILKHSAHLKNSKDYVKRIEDDDDGDEYFVIPASQVSRQRSMDLLNQC